MLGRYELVEILGQGGMGEVFLARISGAAGFEKPCIVKTVLPALVNDPQFLDRFRHEAKVLVHLVHSNIAQVYDMGEAGTTYYMALEYVPGVDLSQLLERARASGHPLPIPFALAVAQKVAEGLGYAHRKAGPDGAPLGIVHRDVSPQNVMVSYDGEVKVIDFGLAKSGARSTNTAPARVMGKLGYMSPEQARGERVDRATDIYSLGVVVWEMLAGRPMIPAGTMGEMVAATMNPKIPRLGELRPDIDDALDAVVRKALAPDPKDRYARAEDFARALNDQLLRLGRPVVAEDLGDLVRQLCPDTYARQQALLSGGSVAPPARTPSGPLSPPEALAPTLIRSPSAPLPPGQLSKSLELKLVRLSAALARTPGAAPAAPPPPPPLPVVPSARSRKMAGGPLAAMSSIFLVAAFTSGNLWLLVPAAVLAALAALSLVGVFGQRLLTQLPGEQRDPTRAHIGLGATVAADATIEPGASVEMGATVRSGAVVRRGAVVQMGATVGRNAIIEENARIGWGADVGPDAVVGEGSVLGAGSDVSSGAQVPPNTTLMPGSTWSRGQSGGAKAKAKRSPAQAADPRRARIDSACDKLESELAKAPETVREFLGSSMETARTLRRTCHELIRREAALRDEASDEALAELDREQAALEKRVREATDAVIRRSLEGALASIADQRRQREALRQSANRIDAEVTRLLWLIEGIGMQLVRVRSTGTAGQAPNAELATSVQQLHDEIGALADALDEVSGVQPIAPISEGDAPEVRAPTRERV